MDPRTPTVHLNGTSLDVLMTQRIDLAEALRLCLRALLSAEPNGRDYPGPRERLTAAVQRHYERNDAIQKLLDEVQQEIEEIASQEQ